MEEFELWCLGTGEELTDYQLCDWDELPKLYKQDSIRYQYNQANQDWSKKSCTIFSAMWALSDLKNYEFSLAQLKEVDELSYQNWRVRWNWWYVKSAVHLVYEWWNSSDLSKKYWKVAYYRMSKFSSMVDEALKYRYTLVTNFAPTVAYNNDYKADWILNWYNFWKETNWHAVDIIWEDMRAVKDSYKWRKTTNWKKDCNIYWLENPLSKLTNYSDWLYIYTNTDEDKEEEIKKLNKIKSKLLAGIPINSELWELTGSENYKVRLHDTNNWFREWLEYVNKRLTELS